MRQNKTAKSTIVLLGGGAKGNGYIESIHNRQWNQRSWLHIVFHLTITNQTSISGL